MRVGASHHGAFIFKHLNPLMPTAQDRNLVFPQRDHLLDFALG
jgi:hypothetical protein